VRLLLASWLVATSAFLPVSSFVLRPASSYAQDPSLPDTSLLFAAVRENLARAGRVEDGFGYKERRTRVHMNPFGRLGTGGTVLSEFTPLAGGLAFTRRVIERDGKAVIEAPVERIRRRRARDRAQSPSAIEDALGVLEFSVARRETASGRPIVVLAFTPRRDAKPKTREGRMARAFKGLIWVDEQAREVVRAEATAIDSISYGYGLVARLGAGTSVTLVRERVEDEVWLPTSIRFTGEGRAMLLRKLNVDFSVEWFDYRRVTP
jgi:hypothetical protein